MATVVVARTGQGLAAALDEVFAPYGGVRALIPAGAAVYIKPNAVHFTPHVYTDPAVLGALLGYLRDHGYQRLAVMDGATGGNFSRLVFAVTGYTDLCQRYGAEAIYLDEGPTSEVALRDGTRARIARRLRDEVVRRRGEAYYLSLPKLKTHPLTVVTLGVKNQQGFPVAADRMASHTHEGLHRRLAALYDLVRPDFCLIDGTTVVQHGHLPPAALAEETIVPLGLLIGGTDTLAVDAVGARLLGYAVAEVEHLRLCAEWELGEGRLECIALQGELPVGTRRYPHAILGRFHPGVRWVVGRQRACLEGCRGNSECLNEILYNDYGGRGGWTLVCGAGFAPEDLEGLPGDILVVGPCACAEVGKALQHRYPRRRVHLVSEHNDLMANTRWQARLMGITPLALSPLPAWRSAWLLVQARLHGLNARVPPILG